MDNFVEHSGFAWLVLDKAAVRRILPTCGDFPRY